MPMAWIDEWGSALDPAELAHETARAVASYLAYEAADIANVGNAYRNAHGAEILLVELRTDVPQHPVVPILPVEPLGIAFGEAGSMPLVMALREDFPDTEHQQLVPEGCPAAICVDDRPWDEAQLTWTPAELLQRIVAWFHRAARGELHDPNQPLDPFFGVSPFSFVFPRAVLGEGGSSVELAAFGVEAGKQMIVQAVALSTTESSEVCGRRILPLAYRVPPERMRRMRKAPSDLASLAGFLKERDIELINDLRQRILGWSGASATDGKRLGSLLAIIVDMPVVGPDGGGSGAADVRMFLTERPVGDIGVALGVLLPGASDEVASRYAPAIVKQPVDEPALRAIRIELAQVHVAFDPDRAAELAGFRRDPRQAVLVGAGAIGSHLAESLVREGRFVWDIVDDDHLLPHNLARHTLSYPDVGRLKAGALKDRLNGIFAPTTPPVVRTVLACNVLRPGEHAEALQSLLAEAAVILDASASVAAARHLSDLGGAARRASAFFNPSGGSVVVLVEAEDRSVSLRDLEAQYYGAVLRLPVLERHLSAVGERFAYTGACRAVTNRIPESRAALLSALAAQGLGRALDSPEPAILLWLLGPDGEVEFTRPTVAPVEQIRRDDWNITLDADLKEDLITRRAARLPEETGGALLGTLDARARRIHLVEALAPPSDSVGSVAGFERGIAGLTEVVTARMARVMDQVRYVGEWHSHPPQASTTPSATDLRQLGRSASMLSAEGFPALSLIVGEREVNVLFKEGRPRSQDRPGR